MNGTKKNMSALGINASQRHDGNTGKLLSITLEAIIRLRSYIADHILINRGFVTGVAYQHTTLLYELPLPAHSEVANSAWTLPFLLMDTAQAIVTVGETDYLTWTGLHNLIDHARNRLRDLDLLIGNVTPNQTFLDKFDHIHQYFTCLYPSLLRAPDEANQFIFELLETAGLFQEED